MERSEKREMDEAKGNDGRRKDKGRENNGMKRRVNKVRKGANNGWR